MIKLGKIGVNCWRVPNLDERHKDFVKKYLVYKIEWKNVIFEDDMEKFVNTPLDQGKKFDVIVIDGAAGLGARFDCVEPSLHMIKRKGMIILDSSEWHINTARELNKQHKFIPVNFNGFMPLLNTTTSTTCYISREFYRETKKIDPIGGTIVDFEPSLVDKSMKG